MTTYLGKSCSFGLPRVPFVNCRHFMHLVISFLILRAGCGIWLYQFLIIAYLFTLLNTAHIQLLLKIKFSADLYQTLEFNVCTLRQLGPVKRICVFEHSVMTNFNCACYSEGPVIWLSVWRFFLTHCLYEQAAKVLARLRGCAGSPEPSLLA